jgi:hypothetical protein
MLAFDLVLGKSMHLLEWGGPVEAFRSVPLSTIVWLFLWFETQAFALSLLVQHFRKSHTAAIAGNHFVS